MLKDDQDLVREIAREVAREEIRKDRERERADRQDAPTPDPASTADTPKVTPSVVW